MYRVERKLYRFFFQIYSRDRSILVQDVGKRTTGGTTYQDTLIMNAEKNLSFNVLIVFINVKGDIELNSIVKCYTNHSEGLYLLNFNRCDDVNTLIL